MVSMYVTEFKSLTAHAAHPVCARVCGSGQLFAVSVGVCDSSGA